jgi:hypothetical protein
VEHRLIDVLLGMAPLPRVEDETLMFGDSLASPYEDQLLEWLQDVETARLVAAHDGRDIASLNAFYDAVGGLSRTVVIAVTENGESICGAYIDPAWREGDWAEDSSKSFLFTLKNGAGVGPTKFPKRGGDRFGAFKIRGNHWSFGNWEGPYIYTIGVPGYGGLGRNYQDVVGQGQAIFNGGEDFFRLARWELWQVA